MSAADVAGWVSAVAAAGGFLAAAYQLWGLRQDSLEDRAAEVLGVAVVTDVVHRPRKPDAGDGRSRWKYTFTVHNPGRLPITDVSVRLTFPVPVRRLHYDGHLDEDETLHLTLKVPVIAGRGYKEWGRTIVVTHALSDQLGRTKASVRFSTPDAGRVTTTWPDSSNRGRINKKLSSRVAPERP